MFGKIRERHLKRVLWGLVIVIIPSFVLWGGVSYLKGRNQQVLAQLGKTRINASDYKEYFEMARVHAFLFEGRKDRKIENEDLQNKAWEYVLLLWKAKKDNIQVTDQEVVSTIKKMFFPNASFNKEWYFQFLNRSLHVDSRDFEKYMRNFLLIDKLYDKYVKVGVTDEELRDFYRKDTQKIKIAYIGFAYDDFKDKVSGSAAEAEDFYRKNPMLFRQDPKAKIKYLILGQDQLKDEILEALSSASALDGIAKKLSLEIKETGFIGPKDPIEGIGWESKVNALAFNLAVNQISPPLEIKNGFIIIQKIDEQPASIPAFKDIEKEVQAKLVQVKLRVAAEQECKKFLEKIKTNNISDLRAFAKREGLDCKITDFFGFADYIEGLGLDEKVSSILFSLNKGQIYHEPLSMLKGSYIVQLFDLTAFDEKGFKENRDKYLSVLTSQKAFIAQLKLLTQIAQEANLKVYPQQ